MEKMQIWSNRESRPLHRLQKNYEVETPWVSSRNGIPGRVIAT